MAAGYVSINQSINWIDRDYLSWMIVLYMQESTVSV